MVWCPSWAASSSTDLHMWKPKFMSSSRTLASCCITRVTRTFDINGRSFSEECDRFKFPFSRLKHPDKLINSTISRFIATNVSEKPVSSPGAVSDSSDPVRVILPFKDQSSADIVRRQVQNLSHTVHTTVSLVFVGQKIERDLKMREAKPPLVNQQCLVYKFECDQCDAGYVGYTSLREPYVYKPHGFFLGFLATFICFCVTVLFYRYLYFVVNQINLQSYKVTKLHQRIEDLKNASSSIG